MFCYHCGQQIPDGASFCGSCGAAVPPNPQTAVSVQNVPAPQPEADFDASRIYAGNGAVRSGIPAPGFSDRCNDPEILNGIRKNRKAGRVFWIFLIPLPIVGFIIYSLVTDKMPMTQAVRAGVIVSAVFLMINIISRISAAAKKPYEAVVTDKRTRIRTHNADQNDTFTEYTTVVQTTDGRRKKIVETDRSRAFAWNYLSIGDRFRFHPDFAFPYERYDKAAARCHYCVVCQTENPVEADRCKKCGAPLLK